MRGALVRSFIVFAGLLAGLSGARAEVAEVRLSKQYGLQLSIPILNGMQNRSTHLQQKILYDNSQWARKNVEYQIQNEVIRTVYNYRGAKKAYTITTDQLKSAELAFQLEKERFDLGVTNFVDFVNANRTLVQAQADKARAEYNLVFQKILMEYAVGTLDAEELQRERN